MRKSDATSAIYQVIYSDGASERVVLTRSELERWVVSKGDGAGEKKSYRIVIVRVVDEAGDVVWLPAPQGAGQTARILGQALYGIFVVALLCLALGTTMWLTGNPLFWKWPSEFIGLIASYL